MPCGVARAPDLTAGLQPAPAGAGRAAPAGRQRLAAGRARGLRQQPECCCSATGYGCAHGGRAGPADRTSVGYGKSVSVSVDLGGRIILKKKTCITTNSCYKFYLFSIFIFNL